MASKRRGGFRPPELRGTLGTLLRTTTGVVRDALERGAREGRARLDDVRSSRRRTDALASLGELVLDLIRAGEIDLAELPEARDLVRQLDDLDEEEAAPDDAPRAASRRRFDDRASSAPPRRDDRTGFGDSRANRSSSDSRGIPSRSSLDDSRRIPSRSSFDDDRRHRADDSRGQRADDSRGHRANDSRGIPSRSSFDDSRGNRADDSRAIPSRSAFDDSRGNRVDDSRGNRPDDGRGDRANDSRGHRADDSRDHRPNDSRDNRPNDSRDNRPDASRDNRPDASRGNRPDDSHVDRGAPSSDRRSSGNTQFTDDTVSSLHRWHDSSSHGSASDDARLGAPDQDDSADHDSRAPRDRTDWRADPRFTGSAQAPDDDPDNEIPFDRDDDDLPFERAASPRSRAPVPSADGTVSSGATFRATRPTTPARPRPPETESSRAPTKPMKGPWRRPDPPDPAPDVFEPPEDPAPPPETRRLAPDPHRKGGISFDDDDLNEYMHPDDVPPKGPPRDPDGTSS
jgi:hypothetical protein